MCKLLKYWEWINTQFWLQPNTWHSYLVSGWSSPNTKVIHHYIVLLEEWKDWLSIHFCCITFNINLIFSVITGGTQCTGLHQSSILDYMLKVTLKLIPIVFSLNSCFSWLNCEMNHCSCTYILKCMLYVTLMTIVQDCMLTCWSLFVHLLFSIKLFAFFMF